MYPKVSIIIPCYNQGKFLAEALDSVLKQTLPEWEIIIVDDGSIDNSAQVSQKYVSEDKRIKYVYQKNAGPSAARNKGVSLAKAPLIFFLDGDDKIDSRLLEVGVSYMLGHEKCKLFYTRTEYFGAYQGAFDLNYTSYKDLLVSNSIICACIVRRSDFERIGGFDEQLFGYEDWEFFIRLLYHDDVIHQEPATMFYYRVNNNPNSVNVIAKNNSSEKTMYIYQKHIDKYNEFFGTPFHVTSEYNRLSKEITKILNSRSYKLCKYMQIPFVLFRKIFKMR